jgi:hypothetical protein
VSGIYPAIILGAVSKAVQKISQKSDVVSLYRNPVGTNSV